VTQSVSITNEFGPIGEFLDEFRETVDDAVVRLNQIPDEQSGRTGRPGSWTQKQILGHLIDSAANNHQRFVRAHSTSNLVFDGYKQDDWVEVQKYDTEPWSDLITLWSAYNRHLIHVIDVMPEETLKRARTEHNLDQLAWTPVATSEPTTLEYFVRDYVGHMKHHLNQIFSHNLTDS
jgi:hypothetical protein